MVGIVLEQHMVLRKLRLRSPEVNVLVGGVRDDVAIKCDVGIVQRRLHLFFQLFVELYLRVFQPFQVADAFLVNEGHVLPFPVVHPQDEVWVEVAGLKEADALAALVAQQIDLTAFEQTVMVLLIERADGLDEPCLAYVQGHGRDFHQWLIGVLSNILFWNSSSIIL